MKLIMVLILSVTYCYIFGKCSDDNIDHLSDPSSNLTNPDKDMYVIRATVYQIGILTNKTDNVTNNFNSTGNQESVTLYHTNGTNIDLSKIPEPFLTNVTAQTLVGVAPIPHQNGESNINAWGALSQLTHPTETTQGDNNTNTFTGEEDQSTPEQMMKRSAEMDNLFLRLFKRDTSNSTPIRVVTGAALIPPEANVQSISLPPLLSLNNNLTDIPVPIPNTSVVHYAKVNTLVQKP